MNIFMLAREIGTKKTCGFVSSSSPSDSIGSKLVYHDYK